MCGEAKVVHSTGHLSESHVSRWQGGLSLAPGSFKRLGYDFKQPSRYPDAEQANAELPTQSVSEIFEYTISLISFMSRFASITIHFWVA